MNHPSNCKHYNMVYFHENAPSYCPDCGSYIDGTHMIVFGNLLLKERKKKINKILTKI